MPLNKPTVKKKINNRVSVSLIATRIYITLSGKCIDLENIELQRTSFVFNTSAVFGIFIMRLGSYVNSINVDNVKCVFGSSEPKRNTVLARL